ncbi:MAG: response regulator transcription factor [Acidobacteria bacterium]|nr:response regulator transcription factor [Acidobacteriota bacterium]
MPSSSIHIFVVDDHTLFREGVVAAIDLQKDFQVVGHCGGPAEAKRMLPHAVPDILLLEIQLPDHGNFELLQEMHTLSPGSKTVAMGDTEPKEEIIEAMRLGARGFLGKDSPPELFFKCIRKVRNGEIWLNSHLTEAVMAALGSHPPTSPADTKTELSRREMEVVQLLVQGYKNRDIAEKLFISEKTVKNHLSAIFNKLGVSDRLELTLYAFEKRLFRPDSS